MENDKKSDDGFPLRVSVQESETRLILQYPVRGGFTVPFDWQIMCPMDECKISLVLNDKQMEILANNRKVQNATYEVGRTLVRQRRAVFIDPRSADAGFISFAFTKQ
ncbi:uncharacterized protein LOC132754683 [Ruditapes philippinarum]|uniref:uncharacterized protein LOC132754683 n=1 Tax=Ruditapes philippinarum TaxID=129788 RepID=UPI00295B73C6|nr:uncharacterized protein LOC132754683 [Ruditapes philippinarum]